MRLRTHFGLGYRIVAGYALLLLLMAVVGFFGLQGVSGVNSELNLMLDQEIPRLLHIERLNGAIERFSVALRGYLFMGDPKLREALTAADAEIREQFAALCGEGPAPESSGSSAAGPAPAVAQVPDEGDKEVQRIRDAWEQCRTSVFGYLDSGQRGEVMLYMTDQGDAVIEQIRTDLAAMLAALRDSTAQAGEAAKATVSGVWTRTLGTLGISVALGIILAISLSASIVRPTGALARVAQEVASGRLQVKVPGTERRDEVGATARAFAEMVGSLRTVVQEISGHAKQVASTGHELAASADEAATAT
ncbi:MAG: methyl-accepting chemotaxis protein, partial [Firmicutes bacterium]|nr:methyl-accepting chemotaxis protein [Bacillota bacterium]